MERVLVTGGTGLVGVPAVHALRLQGCEVHVLTRKTLRLEEPGVKYHCCDLFDENTVRLLMNDICPVSLLHLAWNVEPGYLESYENIRWLDASLHLLDSFIRSGGRRAFMAGTCLEYAVSEMPLGETGLTAPRSLYAKCKRELFFRAAETAERTGTALIWGRFFYLFGKGERRNRAVPSAITSLLNGEQAVCKHASARRDYLCADDAAEAAVNLLLNGTEGIFNIASGADVSMGELFRMIGKLTGHPERIEYREASIEPPIIRADISRLQDTIPFHPLSLEKRLNEAVEWWKQQIYMEKEAGIIG